MCPASLKFVYPTISSPSIGNIGSFMPFTENFFKYFLTSGFSNNDERFISIGSEYPEPPIFSIDFDSGFVDVSPPVSYTHLRAHETRHDLVCRLLLEKQKT